MAYSANASITIDAPKEKIWDALTKPALVKEYFYDTNLSTTWEVGDPITFSGSWKGNNYKDKGEVLSYNEPESLSYSYFSSMSGEEDIPENHMVVTYDVDQSWQGMKVTVTMSEAKTQEKADHSAKGWEEVLEKMKKMVEAQV